VPTREQIRWLVAAGHDYAEIGRALGIPAGQAYLIMTGMPADGGEQPRAGEEPEGFLGSPQHLVYPPAENPTARAAVRAWTARRAAEMRGTSA
jgi:hypothetical protein